MMRFFELLDISLVNFIGKWLSANCKEGGQLCDF